ncbi:bifunctional MFS transporter superfamily/AmpG-like permease-Acetyl-coenzyme A transporter 1/NTF2-like domain superfamily/Nuclear transport factor 2 [Babesia duncani]|uniref:Bifunctional MFS transporter superfamily/AmpG-like permease-Acetyl-coenzyme A transporter 1/NTF2-like domain superfamily/Nuclear transport factor 2 n=1 Tax=Babesia duncani TaxID=323732 RepID=A0AAD9PIM6_9APIC|nr:bifunctional MFS transporter superfamily/AmpG-like permease-Acetyl-coenzyme A transporter 1/NTF2-like domain superfamily/Nuclear transport factor 2 [Babesia duncani]
MSVKHIELGSVCHHGAIGLHLSGRSDRQHDRLTWNDYRSMGLLLLMYTLQGIPMGIHAAIPLIIYKRAKYTQIALLSCTSLPFCLKLLWAPILDGIYIKRIGKRKTWLIPTQLLCGLFLLYGSHNCKIDKWVGEGGSEIHIIPLFSFFLFLYALAATQDIAVDGWALTMLRYSIRVHASTCNVVGQAFGMNLSFIGFITLNDSSTCFRLYNAWIAFSNFFSSSIPPLDDIEAETFPPFITLSGFIRILGIAIILCTILISFKSEIEEMPLIIEMVNPSLDQKSTFTGRTLHNISNSYSILLKILRLKPVILLCGIMLTKFIFFAPEHVSYLRLLSKGMPKDIFSLITPMAIPMEIMGPPFIAMHIHRKGATSVLFGGICLRIIAMTIYVCYVAFAGVYYLRPRLIPAPVFYGLFFTIGLFHKFSSLVMFVADMSLFAKVSDPLMGGTYMSLFNTISNLGHLWPHSLGLWLIDYIGNGEFLIQGPNDVTDYLDALYVETTVCIIMGLVLLPYFYRKLREIELFDSTECNQRTNFANGKEIPSPSNCHNFNPMPSGGSLLNQPPSWSNFGFVNNRDRYPFTSFEDIAYHFAYRYYSLLNGDPSSMYILYAKDGQMSKMDLEGKRVVAVGHGEIRNYYSQFVHAKTSANLTNVEVSCIGANAGLLLIMITGTLTTFFHNKEETRNISQSVVLSGDPWRSRFHIVNDILVNSDNSNTNVSIDSPQEGEQAQQVLRQSSGSMVDFSHKKKGSKLIAFGIPQGITADDFHTILNQRLANTDCKGKVTLVEIKGDKQKYAFIQVDSETTGEVLMTEKLNVNGKLLQLELYKRSKSKMHQGAKSQ